MPTNTTRLAAPHPAAVSLPYLTADAGARRLRIAVLIDAAGTPIYAQSILDDLLKANYIDVVQYIVATPAKPRFARPHSDGLLLDAYSFYLGLKYRAGPDPLELVDGAALLRQVPYRAIQLTNLDRERGMKPEDVQFVESLKLDVLIDFGARAIRGAATGAAREGIWRYHFGDSRRYPAGSGYIRELVDGSPLSSIELIRLGRTLRADRVLERVQFSTAPFLSKVANRYAPIWGARHLVIQQLWKLQRTLAIPALQIEPSHGVHPPPHLVGLRRPGAFALARWLLAEGSRRLLGSRHHVNQPLQWRIGIRRADIPLHQDASLESLRRFQWLPVPALQSWADPFLVQHGTSTWLFFEFIDKPGHRGQISCGKLTDEGNLVDPRPVLTKEYHLSYPQLIQANGEIYMLPEAAQSGGVDLYRARAFPDQWEFVRRLVEFRCVDSTIFPHAGRWWMMTSPQVVPGHAPITWLFQSDEIEGPWRIHPASPIATDASIARGAGAVFASEQALIRPSQDCSTAYGRAILFNKILSMTNESYEEQTICRVNAGWESGLMGVHTYSRTSGWEAIDGGFRQ